MVEVVLTANLQKYYPKARFQAEAGSLDELLAAMDRVRPRFSGYILEDSGAIRRHVNVFVNGRVLNDKTHASHALRPGDTVHIMQALSGG